MTKSIAKLKSAKLSAAFYKRDTTTVARELLGKRLVRVHRGVRTSGIIIETEAYLGLKDPACHSFHGKRTPRTETFYLDGGHAYVYLIYGLHHCFNVVTGDEKTPEAVLVRAIVPDEGIEEMKKRRKNRAGRPAPHKHLASGPGKLCQALAIDRELNRLTLESDEIFIEDCGLKLNKIKKSPRIGVDYAGHAAKWLLRFTADLPEKPARIKP